MGFNSGFKGLNFQIPALVCPVHIVLSPYRAVKKQNYSSYILHSMSHKQGFVTPRSLISSLP